MSSTTGETLKAAGMKAAVRLLFGLPDGALRRIAGDPPREAAGLAPDAWAMARLAALIEGEGSRDPEATRRETEFLARVVTRPVDGVLTQDWRLDGEERSLRARLYTPASDPTAGPMLVHFHGGGWVQGSLDTHATACARLALEAGVRVLSVEYRLAPEHRFPAQAEDALLAWRSVMADPARFGADPDRIGVVGDSAGGQIATVLCLDLKEVGEPQPACQILIYPVTDCTGSTPARETFATGYYLPSERMRWFEECLVPEEADRATPRLSPLFAEDLSGLAPAHVTVSIADPLRDEGEAYAKRLSEAGVEVTLDRMPMLHAWFNLTVTRSSRRGHQTLARRVKDLFALSQ